MAIFHMNFSNISAGKGRSAIASASYRSGEKLYSEMEGKTYFYAKDVMPESFILVPEHSPSWANATDPCTFSLPKKWSEKNLGKTAIKGLITKGTTTKLKGFKSKKQGKSLTLN